MGFIDADQLRDLAMGMADNGYKAYLLSQIVENDVGEDRELI